MSVALKLINQGFNVIVLERNSTIHLAGAGIHLDLISINILKSWGLDI